MKTLRKILLFPLGLIWGGFSYLRRRLYEKGWKKSLKPSVPTICVGNLAMGGTGKTPHVEYIVRLLSEKYKVAILSRGYKRKTKGFVSTFQTIENIDARLIGDEPMQYFLKFPKAEIAVCEDRAQGIRHLLSTPHAPGIIVLDDAFQHLKVSAGLNILLTEFSTLFTEDNVFPAGNLREFRSNAQKANCIVITKTPESIVAEDKEELIRKIRHYTQTPIFFSKYHYLSPVPLTNKAKMLGIKKEVTVLLLTGIAHPQPLIEQIKSQYSRVELIRFPDHHAYTERDMEIVYQKYCLKNPERTIVFTTEKDASKLVAIQLKKIVSLLPIFMIPIEVEFLFDQKDNFNKIIQDYVRENERNSFVLGTKN